MNKLNRYFDNMIKAYPIHAQQHTLPVNDVYSVLKLKKELLLRYRDGNLDEFNDAMASVLTTNKELIDDLISGRHPDLTRNNLIMLVWEQLGETIEELWKDFLRDQDFKENVIDFGGYESAGEDEVPEFSNIGEFGEFQEEYRLDCKERVRGMQ